MSAVNIINPSQCQTDDQVRDKICSIIGDDDPHVLFPTGYPKAFVGLRFDKNLDKFGVLYDREEMILTVMVEDKCSYETAEKYLEDNCWNLHLNKGVVQPEYIYTK